MTDEKETKKDSGNFTEAKKTYNTERKKQRYILKNFIDKQKYQFLNGFEFQTENSKTGHGATNYKGQCQHTFYQNIETTIEEYDLSNWKWLTLEKTVGDMNYYINVYFQSFDFDNKNGNVHVLFDRVSFDFSKQKDKNQKEEKISAMFNTNITLPLNKISMGSLMERIEEKLNDFKII
ncbi:hypothetical protein [Lactococcus cremoris]|uniref:hypothetical protein n=1 Tax=Lactococcus lactis subsp. cremoris TaxID=1359 RepID=UPI00223BD0F4|nr:hypothetical protein [Lactococcus cremoris]MCT0486640.1 hypothetical protein [Lactococcus cremoris]